MVTDIKHRRHSIGNYFRLCFAAVILSNIFITLFQTQDVMAGGSCPDYTTYCKKNKPDDTSIGNWNLDNVNNTNVILRSDRMGLNDAIITYSTGASGKYEVKNMSDSGYNIPGTTLYCNDKKSVRYIGTFTNSTSTIDLPGEIYLKFEKAAKTIEGEDYDVKMTIKNIKVKSRGTRDYGVPIVWGDSCVVKFGSFKYSGDEDAGHGHSHAIRYDIVMRLYKAGTTTRINSTGKTMLWGFDDVDIPDRVTERDEEHHYSSSYPWAEHVEISSGNYNTPFYLSENHSITVSKDSSNKITIYNPGDDGESGKEDVLYVVNPYEFSYTWAGSNCGTTAAAITGTLYSGTSKVDTGTTLTHNSTNGLPNDSTVTIHKNSENVVFYHKIKHLNLGPPSDNEEYYVQVQENSETGDSSYANTRARQSLSWGAECTSSAKCNYTSAKNSEHEIYTPNKPTGNPYTVSVNPGQTKNVWQRLWFQISNVHSTLGAHSSPYGGECNWSTNYKSGTICIHLYRPPAVFSASVSATVDKDNNDTYSAPSTSTNGTKITSSDGKFKIKFDGYVQRNKRNNSNNDDAGGTVKTYHSTSITANGTTAISRSGKSSASMSVSDTEDVFDTKNIYTGTLKYGEVRTICGIVSYHNVIDWALTDHYSETSTNKCVKVYRDPKPCDIYETSKYQVHSGENLGRVGARNNSISEDYVYTDPTPSLYKSNNGYTQSITIYARPGDSIRFMHNGCAGGQYAANNSGLSATTYKTTYSISGSLKQYNQSNSLTVINSQDYLFGEKIPTVRQTSPLKYNGSIALSSTDTGSEFPVGDNVEYEKISPSGTNNGTYALNTYNRYTYSCDNLNPNVSFTISHYQITGRSSATNDNCHAYSKTGVASDVGKIITQTMSWNHLKVSNSSPNTDYNRNFTAQANVAIPYNYNAQPYVRDTSSSPEQVVYRGTDMPVSLKVFVTPRKNTEFGSGDTANDKKVNTYATITKPTKVTARYFYRKSSGNTEFGAKDVTDLTYNGVLNKNGAFNGNASDSATLANGGSTVGSIDVPVPDTLDIGDKVCVQLTVTPADSHNSFMAAAVNGAGSNNAALMEKGTSSKTAEYCRTVAKLPTISVEGSNAFTGNTDKGFNTSRYTKQFSTSDATKYMFGSWSEYGVYGIVTVNNRHGFASGATFGYQTGNSGGNPINDVRNNSGGVATSSSARGGTCAYSTQTFINSNCASNTVGAANIGNTAAELFRQRIQDRFTSGSSPWIQPSAYNTDCVTSNYNHTHKCISAKGDYPTTHAFADYDVFMNNLEDENGDPIRDENGMIHVRIDGDAYFGAATTNNNYQTDMVMNHNFWSDEHTFNWTYVYEISGTFVLDGDIKVGDIRDGGNNYKDNPILERLGNVRVPIISVNRLHLTNKVKRIDAIILANEIDTCAYNTYSDFLNGNKINVGGDNLSANVCNNTVEFRAPVYTKKLILNRTAGGDSGTSTIKRAEIFDMNMATYLWSFNQMSRYSQAVTVEQKEQAPRY